MPCVCTRWRTARPWNARFSLAIALMLGIACPMASPMARSGAKLVFPPSQ